MIRTDYLRSNAEWLGQRVASQQRLTLPSDMQAYYYLGLGRPNDAAEYADQPSNSVLDTEYP